MSDIVGTSYADISAAQLTQRKLSLPLNTLQFEKKLADGLSGNAFATRQATLSVNDSKIMIHTAVVSGTTILRSLEYMLESAKLASHDGLVSSSTALTDSNGTRISRINIQSAVNRVVSGIESVVGTLGAPTSNILSSRSYDLSFHTSQYGGSILVAPQPLDTAGLDIQNINLMDENGLKDAIIRIRKAIETAQSRLFKLQNLETAFSNPNAFSSALTLFDTAKAGALGTFVDLST